MKILIATDKPFAPVAVQGIRQIVEENHHQLLLLEKYTGRAQLLAAVAEADAAIVRSDIFDAEVLSAGKNLKIVVRAGAGFDNIDLQAATSHNICVMNTPGQNANAVAELAMGLAVMAFRNFYSGTSGYELYGKNLGIHAYGNVGRNVARIAKGFGMQIYAYDAWVTPELMLRDGVKPVKSAGELYKTCQVVSLHIPLTADTRASIGKDLLTAMPANPLLINTARKEVVNEAELLEMFARRTDIRYVTDIRPDNHTLLAEQYGDRYFSTPKKTGAQTAEANINAGLAAARQIVDFFATGNQRFRVNK